METQDPTNIPRTGRTFQTFLSGMETNSTNTTITQPGTLSDLPIRDGNSKLVEAYTELALPFRPSYQGWKQEEHLERIVEGRLSDLPIRDGNAVAARDHGTEDHFQTFLSGMETSNNGTPAAGLGTFQTFLSGMETISPLR